MTHRLPAVLNGSAAFESAVHIIRPALPDIESTVERFAAVLRSGRLSNDSEMVRRFEERFADWLDARNVVAMSNGTLTLVLALKALGLSGKVVVPSFTFAATVHAVVWAGLQPVFADIDPQTLNVTPETVEAALTEGVSAVMPVSVFGSPCDVEGLEALAHRKGLRLVFDSAQAIGSRYKGRKLGRFGDAESFSVHATKVLPTGEGGVVATQSDALADELRSLRNFGLDADADCLSVGLNAKMCEFPAVLGLLGIPRLDEALARRKELAERYVDLLSGVPGIGFQRHLPQAASNNQIFVILVDEREFGLSRDGLMEALRAENIFCRRYFHPPMHRTKVYAATDAGRCELPATERVADRCLCLPLYSDMADEVVARVCQAVARIHDHSREVALALGLAADRKIVAAGAFMQHTKRDLCIALPSRPKSLYDEMARMLLDVLADSEYDAEIVADGDRRALDADLLLMIGDCMEFENYSALLGGAKDRKPATALWLLDTLPPATLNDKAARVVSRLGIYSRGLRILRSYLKPARDILPIGLRRKLGLSACSTLLRGILDAMGGESQGEVCKLDVNSQYEIFGRYEWINRNYPKGWIDRIVTNTAPKREFLVSMGIPANFVPLGFHPQMGRRMDIERDIDVLFIGELDYGRRKAIVEYAQRELEKRGRSVTVVSGGCYGEARIELMNRAKISLNVPRFPWDIPTIRVFLSVGCGALVVSEEMGDTAPFVSGRHIVQARLADLADAICRYLERDDEREAIVQNAFALIEGDLTLSNSLARVLGLMESPADLLAPPRLLSA